MAAASSTVFSIGGMMLQFSWFAIFFLLSSPSFASPSKPLDWHCRYQVTWNGGGFCDKDLRRWETIFDVTRTLQNHLKAVDQPEAIKLATRSIQLWFETVAPKDFSSRCKKGTFDIAQKRCEYDHPFANDFAICGKLPSDLHYRNFRYKVVACTPKTEQRNSDLTSGF